MSEDRVFQRHQQKIYFQNADMDFYFLWVFAYQGYGGAEEGECFYTASRIKEGNPKTWVKMWAEMANRIEAQSTTIKKKDIERVRGKLTCKLLLLPSDGFLLRRE